MFDEVDTVHLDHVHLGSELNLLHFFAPDNGPHIIIKWELFARGFNTTDQIKLQIHPLIEKVEYTKYIDNPGDYNPTKEIKCKYE